MSKLTPKILLATAGVALSVCALPTHAALSIDSWQIMSSGTYRTFNADGSATVTGVADDAAHTPTGVDMTVTAWSTGFEGATSGILHSADLKNNGSSGLGVLHNGEATTSPDHAMDNMNGGRDIMLFDFQGKEVSLFEVQIGWYSPDSDISVLAWGGDPDADAATIENSLTAGTFDSLTSRGWDVIGNYDIDSDGSSHVEAVNSLGTSSAYWLVGAYNAAFGGCSDTTPHYCQDGNDAIKLKELSVHYTEPMIPPPSTSVAAPSTWLLMMVGMMAPVAMRRRREKLNA